MTYLIGIDLGSTSLKAVIYNVEGNVVASASRPTEKHTPEGHPEWVVWKPEQIWGGTAAAIKEAVAQLGDPHAIAGVAVTGMGVDAVPIDEGGRWLYPFISWHDQRAAPQQQWWLEHIGAEKTFSTGGWPIWAINTALRMLWVAEHEPEVHARTHKWLLIEDFLNFMLSGALATDYTMASCTLLFDQTRLDWSDEILGLAGIERRVLCDPHPSGTRIGEVTPQAAAATGLPVGTPVVLGGHDFLCGALPVGAFRPGLVLDVTGTWEVVLTPVKTPTFSIDLLNAGMAMEAHVAPGVYAGWGGAVAAEMVEWFRREYGFEAKHRAATSGGSDWDYLIELAASSSPGARGVMFLPHMSGASCPVADPASKGAFAGLTTLSTRGDMLRAIFEGLDYQFLDIITAMETIMGIHAEEVVAVGGAIRNRFWMQNKADVIGRRIVVPAIEEATPLGAAMLAGIGVGAYRDMQDAFEHVYRPGESYEPDLKLTAQYAEWFEVYRQLYPALREINHSGTWKVESEKWESADG
jgi:xylulokinase